MTVATIGVFLLLPLLCLGNAMIALRLRSKHQSTWHELGEPVEWLTAATTSVGRHIFTFLDSGKYLLLGDMQLTVLCRAVRLGWYSFFLAFVVAVFGRLILWVIRDAI